MSQQTIVTGTITDPSGNIYKNCSYSVSFVNNTGSGTLPLISGSTFQTLLDGGSCDSTGSFSQPLFDNNQITPLGTQWKFSVCDQTGKTCFTYTTPICPAAGCITGTSISISAAISAVAPALGTPISPGIVGGSLVPSLNNTYNLGSASFVWANGYFTNLPNNMTLAGNNIFSGTSTFNGQLNETASNTGNVAAKNNTSDSIIYVSQTGNDSNDGLSWGSAKATISAAVTALPICTPTPSTNGGSPTNSLSGKCGTVQLGAFGGSAGAGYTISSPITINSLMVRIIGVDKFSTQLQCTTTPCIKFNGGGLSGAGAPNPVLGASGGLEKLSIIGNGSASQICLDNLDAAGISLKDIRVTGCSGTSAIGILTENDANGESERIHWDGVTLDGNTINADFSASNSGGLSSIAHAVWINTQITLNNGQTAIRARNFATVAFELCTGVINTNVPNTNTYTGVLIQNSAVIKGHLGMIVDNGAGGTLTLQSGTTSSNFNVWGWNHTQTIYTPETTDLPIYSNTTGANFNNGICWLASGVVKMCASLDGSNLLGFAGNGSGSETFAIDSTFGNGIWLAGSGSGIVNLRSASAGGGTATIPNNTGIIAELNLAQTFTANQLFTTIGTATNCAVNSASPATCGSAASGAFVVPTTTTTYTVNTTAITSNSTVFIQPRTYVGNLPSSPTCVVPAITTEPVVNAIVAGTSFTINIASTTGQTCWNYWIVN